MKNLLAATALTLVLTATSAFASCPCNSNMHVQSYNMPYKVAVIQPVQPYAEVPFLTSSSCCKKCDPCKKKGFFSNMRSKFTNLW